VRADSDRDAWLILAQAAGVGPATAGALVAAAGGSPRRAVSMPAGAMARLRGFGVARAERIARAIEGCDPRALLDAAEGAACRVLTRADEDYPALLDASADAPPAIFVRGELPPVDVPWVALVGTRRATIYGERTARTLGEDLARAGFVVVSGLAEGIDTFAHEGCIAGGGKTVAVLGSGVDVVFPPSNVKLAADIAASGALVSEHPPGTRADKFHFPRRNRIVAALSACVVVVEAPLGSGALITAALARDHVPVLAVPGPIGRMHEGCHQLLRQGARLCEGVSDVYEAIDRRPAAGAAPATAPPRRPPPPAGPALVVWRVLDPDEALDLDEIALRTGLSPDAVAEGVTLLELDGRAVRVPGIGLRRG
jgi:DNA processing protein